MGLELTLARPGRGGPRDAELTRTGRPDQSPGSIPFRPGQPEPGRLQGQEPLRVARCRTGPAEAFGLQFIGETVEVNEYFAAQRPARRSCPERVTQHRSEPVLLLAGLREVPLKFVAFRDAAHGEVRTDEAAEG